MCIRRIRNNHKMVINVLIFSYKKVHLSLLPSVRNMCYKYIKFLLFMNTTKKKLC